MGKPSPTQTDQANQVLTGSFTAVGPSAPILLFGGFNVAIWNQTNEALTTTHSSASASVAAASNIVIGNDIVSINVPNGTTVGAIASTTVTLAFPPGSTSANVVSGTDSAALFINGTFSATIQLERSFDGGQTWIICSIDGSATQAIYSTGATVSVVVAEYERGVFYRLNCTVYSSGTIEYRISTTGQMAQTFGVVA